jgi:hypothetical protein
MPIGYIQSKDFSPIMNHKSNTNYTETQPNQYNNNKTDHVLFPFTLILNNGISNILYACIHVKIATNNVKYPKQENRIQQSIVQK